MLNRDGLVVFSKGACPACKLIEPVMQRAAADLSGFQVVSQDDPKFPSRVAGIVDDRELDHSWLNNIEFTPTLIRFAGGRETERVVGLPKPLSVYEEHFEISVPLGLSAAAKLPLTVRGALGYQACQGAVCYAPQKLKFDIVLPEKK